MLFQPAVVLFFLVLLYNSSFSASAPATAIVDGPEEFKAALLDGRVQRILLEGNVVLPQHRDSTPRFLINRNVTIMSVPGSMHELDFNHAAGCALVCSSCTVTFSSIVVANAKRLQAVTFFRGSPGSKVVFKDAYIMQLACAPPAAGRSILRDAPRSRQFPQPQQPQQLLEATDATYKGRPYPSSIRALDVAIDLPLEVLEREIFSGGYSLLYENVTQLCLSSVPDSCLARSSLALCIEQQTQQLESGKASAAMQSGTASVAVISGSPQQGADTASFTAGAVAGAVVGAVAGTTLLLAACAATWHVRRKRAQRGKGGLSPPDSWMFILPSYSQQLQDERRRKLGWLSGLQAGSSSAGDSGDSGPAALEPQDRGQRLSAAITTKVLTIIEQRPFGGVSVVGDGAAGGTSLRRGLSGGVVSDATGTDESESELVPRSSGGGSRPVSLEALEAEEDELQIVRAIGRGGFGTVYKATWHGTPVAVKVVQLPPGSKAVAASESVTTRRRDGTRTWDMGLHKDMRPGGASAIEAMAVQEAAIGSSMAHPNIVAVYSVLLKPMQQYQSSQLRMLRRASGDEQAEEPTDTAGESSDAAADTAAASTDTDTDLVPWEMQLIMEYCDQGTLRDVLDAQLIFDRSTGANHIPTVLSLAQQVARAMQYLHKEHILHGDLKASNVLLQSAVQFASFTGQRSPALISAAADAAPLEGSPELKQAALPGCDLQWLPLRSGCSVTAKVSDFGLSTSLDPTSTHITRRGPGTVTHTAPETLIHGHCSRASDVYAYGMLLYELATGNRVFADVPQMMIGRLVVEQKVRPKWPAALTSNACWSGIISLVEICWQQNPHARPTFSEVLAELRSLARGNRVSLSITDRLHRAVSAAAAEAPAAAPPPPPPPPAAEWRLDNSSGSHHQHASATLRSVAGVSSAAAHPLLCHQQQKQQQGHSDDGCMVLQLLDNTAGSMASTSTADGHQQPLLCVPESLLYQPSSVTRRAAAAADAAAAGAIVLQPLDGTAEEPPGGGL